MRRAVLLLCLMAALDANASACGSSSDEATTSPPASDAGATTATDAATADASSMDSVCPRKANTTDHVRKVIISHPTNANAEKAKDYEVLELGLDGNLTRNGPRFTMGRNFDAPIVFSPDGVVGVAVQDDDGSLGIFRMDPGVSAPVVVDASFGKDHFYADWAVFSPDGSRIYVADINRNPNGGLHEVAIACDGTPTYRGQVLVAPGTGTLAFLPKTTRALVVSASSNGVPKGNDLLLVDLGTTAAVAGSVSLFGDDALSPHGVGITPDGKLALVPDGNDAFGTNRLGVVSVEGSTLKKVGVLSVDSPSGIAMSPYGNAALVTAAGGPSVDGLIGVKIDASNLSAPVSMTGKLAAMPKPQLPTGPVLVENGSLRGLVLVSEVDGIRRMRFETNGSITDLGLYALQGGLEASPGSLGVQP